MSCVALWLLAALVSADVSIPYTIGDDGYVSLAVYDGQGRLVRTLLTGVPRNPGSYCETWDGRDRYGVPQPAGDYTWKLLCTQGLRTEFMFRMGSNFEPAWEGPVGAHNNMCAIAVDGDNVFCSTPDLEGGHAFSRIDFSGRYVWGSHPFGGGGHGRSTVAMNGRAFELVDGGVVNVLDWETGRLIAKDWNVRAETGGEGRGRGSDIDMDGDRANNLLVLSCREKNAIRWYSAADGKLVDEAANVPEPAGVAVAADGTVLAISKGAVVSLSRQNKTPKTVIPADLLASPVRLSVDQKSGEILVAENSFYRKYWDGTGLDRPDSHHQVKRFSKDGRLQKAHGRPQGRADGAYVPTDFRGISDISSDNNGGFFITEFLITPRRAAHFDRDGKCLQEYFGGQPWGWNAVPEPDDPTIMWYFCNPFGMVRCKVDYAARKWRVLETYTDGFQNTGVWSGAAHMRLMKRGDLLCIVNSSSAPLGIIVYDAKQKRVRIANGSGKGYRDKKWQLPEALRPADGSTPGSFLWNDLNDDGKASRDEITWTGRVAGGYIDPNDFTLYTSPSGTEYYPGQKYAVKGFTAGGTPIYVSDVKLTIPRWRESGDLSYYPGEYWRAADGSLYACFSDSFPNWENHGAWYFNSCSGIDRLVKWDKAGNQVWSVGRHSPDADHEPGSTAMARAIIGMSHGCIVWSDGSDEEGAQPTVWTDDGLYVSEIPRLQADKTPEWVSRLWCGAEESFGYVFDVGKDTYLTLTTTCGGYPVFKVTGWDGWQRQNGTVKLGESPAKAAGTGDGLKAEYFNTPDCTGQPALTRVDPEIWFHWIKDHDKMPDGVTADEFSVRWSGQVEATTTEEYRFTLETATPWKGEGQPTWVKLSVDGRTLIDTAAGLAGPTSYGICGTILLRGGERYGIKLECGYKAGKAVAKLCWDTPSRDRRRIVKAYLYSTPLEETRYPGALLAHWSFDEAAGSTAADASGNNQTAVISGATRVPGKIGRGLRLDGKDDEATAELNPSGSGITLSLWFKTNQTDQGIIALDGQIPFLTLKHNGYLSAQWGRSLPLTAAPGCADDQWHHAVYTCGGPFGDQRLYVDGRLRAHSPIAVPNRAGPALLKVGQYKGADKPHFTGLLDEVRLYDRALSAREIIDEIYRREVGLIAHIPCDEGKGVTAASTVGAGIFGTLTGNSTWAEGRFGGGVAFDAVNASNPAVMFVDHEVRVPQTNYTVAFWFKSTSPNGRLLCADRDSPYNNNWVDNVISLEGGSVDARLRDGGPPIVSKLACNDGKWHHVATTIGGGTGPFKLYVDGVLQGEGTLTSRKSDSNRLGIDVGPESSRCKVTMDEIRVYGRALSAEEIAALAGAK